jgi:peptidyl-prolyl cis-trans isomerase A (cyclophilin A)
LYVDQAPVTAGNFLNLVKKGVYDGGSFYRTVRGGNDKNPVTINVIQGGIQDRDSVLGIKPISHENTDQTEIKHKDGVISMARTKPGSATTEFFICVGDQPELDIRGLRNPDGQGFAAFGKVIDGMDVVGAIWRGNAEGQKLEPPVRIHNMKVR